MNGVASNVQLMTIRAVPNGDEYDKDVALAIRYAVDNGAKIINMSFGKGYSTNPEWVYDAIKYAEKHDVLLVHAAGNDSSNLATYNNYPTDAPDKLNEIADNVITIGSSTRHYDENLVSSFSNYGKVSVDIFAPGSEVYSTIPNNEFANRMSYVHQLIIASKITRGISLELLPTIVHRNYVDQTILNPDNGSVDENDLYALGFAGRFKVSKRMAFVVDYFLTFSEYRNDATGYYDALSVGIEIETGGHVFHINVSNSGGIIENDFIPSTESDWGNGGYRLGFNISRVFSF